MTDANLAQLMQQPPSQQQQQQQQAIFSQDPLQDKLAFPSITGGMTVPNQLSEDQLKGKSEKKYHRRKKTDINDKPYKCGCKKEFNDYSSLYTHIKTNHDLQIPEKTVLPQLKKKDVMQFLKEQKGEPVQTDEFNIEISQFILFYLDQEDLLQTFLKFEDSIDKSAKENTISEFFHPEDQQFFTLEDSEQSQKEYPNLFQNECAVALSKEYLKPFTKDSANELLYLIDQIINQMTIQQQKQEKQEIQYNYAEIIQEIKHYYQENLSLKLKTLQKLKQFEFLIYIQDFTIYFCTSLQNLKNNSHLLAYTNQQNLQMQQQTQPPKERKATIPLQEMSRKSSQESIHKKHKNSFNGQPNSNIQSSQQQQQQFMQQQTEQQQNQYNLLMNNPLNNIIQQQQNQQFNILHQQQQFQQQLQQFPQLQLDNNIIEQASAFIPTQGLNDPSLYLPQGSNLNTDLYTNINENKQ